MHEKNYKQPKGFVIGNQVTPVSLGYTLSVFNKNFTLKEAEQNHDQTHLKKTRTRSRMRQNNHADSQSNQNTKTQRSISALKIGPRNNVGGQRYKEHDQS